MFPKGERLPHTLFTGRPIRRVRFKYGEVCFYSEERGRVAVVVSKKVAADAVDRNRLRRRVLHALKSIPRTSSCVVYPTRAACRAPYIDLRDQLAEALASR